MTTEQSVQERVQQAIKRAYELVAERNMAIMQIQGLKQAEDAVRLSNNTEAIDAAALLVCEEIKYKAATHYDAAVGKLHAPLQEAQAVYNQAVSTATKLRDDTLAAADADYQHVVEASQQEQQVREATARAAVHRAEREAAALQATIDQHRRQVQEALGIDLNRLVT